MLITRGFGYNTGSGGTGETTYVYAPDPILNTDTFGEIKMCGVDILPNIQVSNSKELIPNISSEVKNIYVATTLLKPSLHFEED